MRVDTQVPMAIRRDTLSRFCASEAAEGPLRSKQHQKLVGINSRAALDVHCQNLQTPKQHLIQSDSKSHEAQVCTSANLAKLTAVQADFDEQASHFCHASGNFAQAEVTLKHHRHYVGNRSYAAC